MLSTLLQELALARDFGRKRIVLDEARLTENPVDRLSRMIKNSFWDNLTRRMDADGIEAACVDPKNQGTVLRSRIYVPHAETEQADYYRHMSVISFISDHVLTLQLKGEAESQSRGDRSAGSL
jgi:alpha,alpha-trehalase